MRGVWWGYVEHYNKVRLNSAIGYITPKDMLTGRQQEIHAERDRKLEAAQKQRQLRRQQAARKTKNSHSDVATEVNSFPSADRPGGNGLCRRSR